MRRAVGIVRVSSVAGRTGDSFVSPTEQRDRIEAAAERGGLRLVDVFEELDVSGGSPLSKRHGLRRAIEAVEAGEADVVVVAYFDRLVRSLAVQAEVVGRVEAAGGEVLAVDVGQVTHGSSAQWLSATMLGAVAEYHRRSTSERVETARLNAIARGVPTFPRIPPGYSRQDDGTLAPNEDAPAVAEAFRMRAEDRASIRDVQAYLQEQGIERGFHATRTMLGSRLYLGEIHFGSRSNLAAHEPIVDPDTWRRAQAIKGAPGAPSDRLLARLGILRCAGCGGRMVVGGGYHGMPIYRCPSKNGAEACPSRSVVKAELVEDFVRSETRRILAGQKATGGVSVDLEAGRARLDRADRALAGAIEALSGMEEIQAAREKLGTLRAERDAAADALLELEQRAGHARVTLTADDLDRLTLDEWRDLIRSLVESVTVARGRGPGRFTLAEL